MTLSELTTAERQARFAREGIVLRIGPFVLRLQTALAKLTDQLAFLYGDFPLVEEPVITDGTVTLQPARRWGSRLDVLIDGVIRYAGIPARQALPYCEWAINLAHFWQPHRHLTIHAAVVERGGRAAIFPAPPGSGKSTLCAALVAAGWRLLSDEVAMIRLADLRLVPVPRPISLKNESISIVQRLAPERMSPACSGTPKGTMAHLRPPADSIRRMTEPAEPAFVIFPKYAAAAGCHLVPRSKAQTLLGLAGNAFNYHLLGRTGFESLAAVVDRVTCYDLSFDAVNRAADMLAGVYSQHARPAACLSAC